MGFFEKLSNTINSTGKEVEQKAKKISGTIKLNGQIKGLNEAIQEYLKTVGELYYKKQEGISEDADIQNLFDKIKKSQNEIKNAEKQIETLKGIYRCPNCGAQMRITDNYCMMCGTKREDTASMIENATVDSEAVFTDIEEKQEAITENELELKEDQENRETDEIAEDENEEGEGIDLSEFEDGSDRSEKNSSQEEGEEIDQAEESEDKEE